MGHDKIDVVFFGSMFVLLCVMAWGSITTMMDTNDFTENCNNRNGVAVVTTTGLACVDKDVILK